MAQNIDFYLHERLRMVELIKQEIHHTAHITDVDELSPAVEQALLKVSRHRFVSDESEEFAYFNEALPIRCGQTISQPLIVALMTELIQPQKEHKVLEIGTGSGYQAAVLAQLVKEVYTY